MIFFLITTGRKLKKREYLNYLGDDARRIGKEVREGRPASLRETEYFLERVSDDFFLEPRQMTKLCYEGG
ncbi:unnamed protein product [marine sediment metagenome]|uniref:Uncharacterized protein n=1 Tax=marine sediment metagenome TaxID=412755 RepID=X1VH48_9ZZZZ